MKIINKGQTASSFLLQKLRDRKVLQLSLFNHIVCIHVLLRTKLYGEKTVRVMGNLLTGFGIIEFIIHI